MSEIKDFLETSLFTGILNRFIDYCSTSVFQVHSRRKHIYTKLII